MSVYLFFENKKLKAVFDNDIVMKKAVIPYIIKYHITLGIYKNSEECKVKLRSKLCDLFSEDLYFMESQNNTWFIKKIDSNKINKEIEIISFNTRYTKINVKGKNITKKDLIKNIPNLNLTCF